MPEVPREEGRPALVVGVMDDGPNHHRSSTAAGPAPSSTLCEEWDRQSQAAETLHRDRLLGRPTVYDTMASEPASLASRIDRDHELPIKRQAELVGISRGTCTTCRGPCVSPTSG